MANYRKSFSFRNGVQVDDSNFVVTPLGLVGIGTTVPTELMDVRGVAKVTGVVTTNNLYTTGIATFSGSIFVGQGVTISSGIISATNFYGDGSTLSNLPTSQWIDVDVGLGFTSIYSAGNVGIATTSPLFSLQIGGSPLLSQNGIGINSTGDVYSSGIITASSFYGDGSNLTGIDATALKDSAGVVRVQANDSGAVVTGVLTTSSSVNVGGGTSTVDLFATGITTIGHTVGAATTIFKVNGYAEIDGIHINAKATTNTHVGRLAGRSLVGGQQNTALGYQALLNNVNSNFNTAIGLQALLQLGSNPSVAFDRNTAVGTGAGQQLTQGSNNTFIGDFCGSLITTASNNTIIGKFNGNQKGLDIRSSSGNIVISDGEANVRFFANSSGDVGINSTTPRAKLDVDGSLNVTGVSTFSNGNVKVGSGNSSAVLRFGDTLKTFDIINNESGNINMYLHNGDVGVSTGRFDWIYGQTNQELMSLNYDGKLGLGKTNPDNTLHVVGTSTVTGNAWFGSDVTISGSLNVDSLPLPSLITTSNILSSSGVSTFFDLDVTNNISIASSVGIGTSVPIVSLDAQNKTALFGTIGINTYTEPDVPLKVSGQSILDSVGIGTTNSLGEGLYLQGSSFVQRNATMSLYDSVAYIQGNGGIGIGTTAVRCQVDFADAGKDAAELNPGEGTGSRAFMLPPRLTNAQKVGLTTAQGAVVYETEAQRLQGYDGRNWNNFDNVDRWVLANNGFDDYTFSGIGITPGNVNDPIIYLARGKVYEFENTVQGSHPFEIRDSNGGSAYTDGVTSYTSGSSTITRIEVPMNAPNTLYYQCTSHAGMGNTISVYPNLLT